MISYRRKILDHIKEYWEENLGSHAHHMILHSLSEIKRKVKKWGDGELSWEELITALKERLKKDYSRK